MDKKELAAMYHDRGCNCCQAVVLAFADDLGLDKELVQKMGEAFGAGMGGMQGTCGALSGAMILAGLKNSDGNTESPKSKAATYKIAKGIHEQFREKAGSTICKELKGIGTGVVLMPCPACIDLAVELAEEMFAE
ncbi:MAG: C-GCAxxG-C-C family protein [Clostridiales bacterium]|nr:C-GCAxxG-C-C family protein [Clostridiales bacterium]